MRFRPPARVVRSPAPPVPIADDQDLLDAHIADTKKFPSTEDMDVRARKEYIDIAGRTAEFARLLREFQIRHNCVPLVPPVKERETHEEF
ncbi:MAG: hypothetical protein DDT36_00704 [Firmicutes bacterium]|nr:hypothetical protein [Bacillota bacterium]